MCCFVLWDGFVSVCDAHRNCLHPCRILLSSAMCFPLLLALLDCVVVGYDIAGKLFIALMLTSMVRQFAGREIDIMLDDSSFL